jgi:hypothetical protein
MAALLCGCWLFEMSCAFGAIPCCVHMIMLACWRSLDCLCFAIFCVGWTWTWTWPVVCAWRPEWTLLSCLSLNLLCSCGIVAPCSILSACCAVIRCYVWFLSCVVSLYCKKKTIKAFITFIETWFSYHFVLICPIYETRNYTFSWSPSLREISTVWSRGHSHS